MSFARILRSSALMGGAQVFTLAAAFIRTKVIAQLMGPAGVGLVGVLTAFNGNVSTLAGWGLGVSGVRLIAGSRPEETASKQAAVRKFGMILSSLGFVAAIVLCWPVAHLTFDAGLYATELLIGGMAVPCIIAGLVWTSILQAAGQVKSLAKAQVISALSGLFIGLPLIFFFGSIGVAISLLFASALPMAFTWHVARRDCCLMPAQPRREDLRALFDLGGGLMIIGVAAQLSAYGVRLAIIRHHGKDVGAGLADAGYYQAAIAIAGSLPAVVFTSMGTDFFPRVAAARDEAEAKMLAERQIEAGLLLAIPIFVGLVTMSRLGISLLYADKFEPAEPLLSWMTWGVFFRLLGWPLGYWLVARGSMRTVVIVELASNLTMSALPILLLRPLGLVGTAVGYFVGYMLYAVAMLAVVRLRTGQSLSARTLLWFGAATCLLLIAQAFACLTDGGFWGLLPTGVVALGSLFIYRRTLSARS